ncbi:hypothetical protein FJR04_02250 [Anabaena sp. UHCC 0204]|nr:hypothetical protein [Anabaena sp. UHCC 0204]
MLSSTLVLVAVLVKLFNFKFTPTAPFKVISLPAITVKSLAPFTVSLKLILPFPELNVCVIPVSVTAFVKFRSLTVVIFAFTLVLAVLVLRLFNGFVPPTAASKFIFPVPVFNVKF